MKKLQLIVMPMNKTLLSGLILFFIFQINSLAAEAFLPQNGDEVIVLPIDSVSIQSLDSKLLTSFYKKNNQQTVWLNKKNTRQILLRVLNHCIDDGLNPKDFEIDKLNNYEFRFDSITNEQRIAYDLLLTLQTQRYVSQLSQGKLDPNHLYTDWDLKSNTIDIIQQLAYFEKGDSIEDHIEKLRPNHLIYKNLRKALQLLNSYPKDTFACIVISKILYKNEIDSSLIPIKRKLIYWKDLNPSDSVTCFFDQSTFDAVKKFQARHGIRVDGAIGKATIDALNFSLDNRRAQIISNLERWRWFPRDFGQNYILVNIPDYSLLAIKNRDTMETRRVVVGVIGRKTAILSSTFNAIILNPTWTVPPTILEEDLLPAATKKSSYFASKNILIYNTKGSVVAPNNWNPEQYKNYRYVQSPGDDNSLGNVKFNFPNQYSVYLHDTNHRDYFGRTFRSMSSGCVRVENPLPLAQYMLNDKRWTMEKICEVIATRKTTSIPLKEKINIHQLYWTAWMDVDGTLQFRQDIYNLDDELYEQLRN